MERLLLPPELELVLEQELPVLVFLQPLELLEVAASPFVPALLLLEWVVVVAKIKNEKIDKSLQNFKY